MSGHDHERPDKRSQDEGFQEIDSETWDNVRDALVSRDRAEAEREALRAERRAKRRRRRAERLRTQPDEEEDR